MFLRNQSKGGNTMQNLSSEACQLMPWCLCWACLAES